MSKETIVDKNDFFKLGELVKTNDLFKTRYHNFFETSDLDCNALYKIAIIKKRPKDEADGHALIYVEVPSEHPLSRGICGGYLEKTTANLFVDDI